MIEIEIAIAASLLLAAIGPARGATLAGVQLPDTVTVDDAPLVLNGMGLRQATALRVKAYVGGLYLEQRSSDPATVIDSRQRKRVTMKFLRDKAMEPSITRFTSLIDDVKKGDTLSFTARPGAGVEVTLRDAVRGTVPGDEFSRALFTVWFGPKPGDENLKRGMLGK